ncbi:MAG: NHL repeat-containing protein [Methyloligellaceae bacterium]
MRVLCVSVLVLLASGWNFPVQAFKFEFVRTSSIALDNPRDLQLSPDNRFLFVSDGDNDRIVILDPKSLELIGHFGADWLDGPYGLDVDAAGRLYVADSHNNRIVVYDVAQGQGRVVRKVSGGLAEPKGVCAHSNGAVYAAGSWSGNVVGFRDGVAVGKVRGLGTPFDLEQAPSGDIWVSDRSKNSIILMSADLKVQREIKGGGGLLVAPHFIDLMDGGDLVVSDKFRHQIKIISTGGKLLATIGTGRPGDAPGEFRMPEGVEISGESLWIADSGNDRIVHYRLIKD